MNGNLYLLGEYYDDKPNGFGIYQNSRGGKMQGYWENYYQHDIGIETWEDDAYYEGNFHKGKKNGIGTYVFSDGSVYEGNWVDNKMNGYVRRKKKYIIKKYFI